MRFLYSPIYLLSFSEIGFQTSIKGIKFLKVTPLQKYDYLTNHRSTG